MMSTLPSMAQAFAILSQEEKQREVKPNNHTVLDSTSLNAYGQSSNSTARKDFKTNYSSTRGGGNNYGNFNNNNVFRGSSSTTRSSLFCEYCKRSGHTKDRCYKLHGYPPNSRFPKGKGSGSAGNVCAAEMNGHGHQNEEDSALKKQMPLNLSKDQYEQLLNLLGTLQIGNGNSNFDNSDNMMSGAVNLAGILACYSSITEIGDLSCRCTKLTAGSWIIDSGASHHMTYTKPSLKTLDHYLTLS
uniref:Retroelement pol polyprotein n=2 Tax=Solanum tuberosum TaxID=4113 RepID=M1E0W7_SOLTU